MPKKKTNLSRLTRQAKRARLRRLNETREIRNIRLSKQKIDAKERRLIETQEQKNIRNLKQKLYSRERRLKRPSKYRVSNLSPDGTYQSMSKTDCLKLETLCHDEKNEKRIVLNSKLETNSSQHSEMEAEKISRRRSRKQSADSIRRMTYFIGMKDS